MHTICYIHLEHLKDEMGVLHALHTLSSAPNGAQHLLAYHPLLPYKRTSDTEATPLRHVFKVRLNWDVINLNISTEQSTASLPGKRDSGCFQDAVQTFQIAIALHLSCSCVLPCTCTTPANAFVRYEVSCTIILPTQGISGIVCRSCVFLSHNAWGPVPHATWLNNAYCRDIIQQI